MNLSPAPRDRCPLPVIVVVVLVALPVVALPTLIGRIGATEIEQTIKVFLFGYPVYVIISAWLACISYPRRPYMTWILVALMVLTHLAMWLLTSPETLNTLS